MYPGIGPKTAERLALFTFNKIKDESIMKFSSALLEIKRSLKQCKNCGSLTDKDICDLCSDDTREKILLIVEGTKDVISFEKTNQFKGRYHVLNNLISPLNGISPDDVNLGGLIGRIKNESIVEVIIATSATIEGEMTSLYIKNILDVNNIKVTRIGYGLPAGGDIEYADEITLIKALDGRKSMN